MVNTEKLKEAMAVAITEEDIQQLAVTFCANITSSQLFSTTLKDEMKKLYPAVCACWQTILAGSSAKGIALEHCSRVFLRQHIIPLLSLFHLTIDEHFSGIAGEIAKARTVRLIYSLAACKNE